MTRRRRRKCSSCGQMYRPDPRNVFHQRYCREPACRRASKAASQRHWRRTPNGRDYFSGPENVRRVREWRKDHPGYWHRRRQKPAALQDVLPAQPLMPSGDEHALNESTLGTALLFPGLAPSTGTSSQAPKPPALQDVFSAYAMALLGLIAHFSGAQQDDIAPTLNRLILLGRQIQGRGLERSATRGRNQTSVVPGAVAHNPTAVQLGGSSPGSG